jgi:hypothetical protein
VADKKKAAIPDTGIAFDAFYVPAYGFISFGIPQFRPVCGMRPIRTHLCFHEVFFAGSISWDFSAFSLNNVLSPMIR